jgi:hypothetical protein
MLLTVLPLTVPLSELVAVAALLLKESEKVDVAVPPLLAAAAPAAVARALPLLLFCPLLLSCDALAWSLADAPLPVCETVVDAVCVLSPPTLRTRFVGSSACADKLNAIKTAAAIVVRFMESPLPVEVLRKKLRPANVAPDMPLDSKLDASACARFKSLKRIRKSITVVFGQRIACRAPSGRETAVTFL